MRRASVLLLASALLSAPVSAAPVAAPHITVELVADATSIAPGRTVGIGVRLAPAAGWHVYWRNPGDSGEAPTVQWTLPAGFTVDALEWPTPTRIATGPLVNFGYEAPTLLATRLHAPRELDHATQVDVAARV